MSSDISAKSAHTISEIDLKVRQLHEKMVSFGNKMDGVEKTVQSISKDLSKLSSDFQKMVADQQKQASLQRAISELVRVRQEIDQKYGNHETIRETMLGVLQATDLALVKKTTISQVSEELMLSTPKYWLAPCLVAVSAWISNDKSLAERAIAEAMKRDGEKTALAMALICRRNGRSDTCFEWLSIYFERQNAAKITEETFTYIDAYVNGVFGTDDKHMCSGFISKWIDEVRGNNSDFEVSQEKKWRDYCERYRRSVSEKYPELSESVKEFHKIDEHIGAINSFGKIRDDFTRITNAFVDQETLKKTVDVELVRLVSHYDSSEISIKNEEEYLTLVRQYQGDEEKAKAMMEIKQLKETQYKLNFIDQMSQEIINTEKTAPSKQKTAVKFLGNYINKGYEKMVAETKEEFPENITINIEKWSGKSIRGNEYEQLLSAFETQMEEVKNQEIKFATSSKPKLLLVLSIFLLVLAGAGLIVHPFLAAGLVVASAAVFFVRIKTLKNTQKTIQEINNDYLARLASGKNKLEATLQQWREALAIVNKYHSEPEHNVVA